METCRHGRMRQITECQDCELEEAETEILVRLAEIAELSVENERLRTELESKTKLMDTSIEYLKRENEKLRAENVELKARLERMDRALRLAQRSPDGDLTPGQLFPGMTFTKGG
jgi:hypothetical protein